MSKDYVVLLHGLGRTSASMRKMERALGARFDVVNIDYPSRKHPIRHLSGYVGGAIRRQCRRETSQIHVVTHSLGGIVLRYCLKQEPPENLGHVVMLSPPNQGSELVDIFRGNVIFRIATGPAGQELGTDLSSVPNRLGPVEFTVGIITGSKSLNPILSHLIPGDDDGRVSVKRAKVQGMTDFMIVPRCHPLIMNSPQVIEQVIHFLEYGRFRPLRACVNP